MTFNIGESVGAYKIIKEIGQGGMGNVFKAYHPVLDRYVAIKSIRPDLKDDTTFVARFLREARVVAKLDHANIVPVFDFSTHHGHPYLVMKYVEGETLKARLKRGTLPLPEAGRILTAMSSALAHAHKQGVLHRDIKPSNILIESDGDVYLSDFGLAKLSGKGVTSTLTIVGTPQYMSPEQGRGLDDLDERSDQYSLAVVLFEMITGHLPFKAADELGFIQHHLLTLPPRPSSIKTGIKATVDNVIFTALAKDRAARYPSVIGLAQAYEKALLPDTAPPVSDPAEATIAFRKLEDDATRPIDMGAQPPSDADDVSVLLVLQPDKREFQLNGKREYVLGRWEPGSSHRPDLDLAELHGMERGVSRRHGRLKFDGRFMFYTDLNSSNGSRLNGERLRPDIPMLIKDGDELTLGKMIFRIYYAY